MRSEEESLPRAVGAEEMTGGADAREKGSAKRAALPGVLLAFALVLAYVESLFPFFFGVPGMKLGLPNFAVVLLLYLDGAERKGWRSGREALLINLLRITLAGFLFGSLFGILFSAAGALASFLVMAAAKRAGCFGIAGVSIAGGVAHNIGQLLVAVFLVKTAGILYYAPFLILAGALTGLVIGVMTGAVLPLARRVVG